MMRLDSGLDLRLSINFAIRDDNSVFTGIVSITGTDSGTHGYLITTIHRFRSIARVRHSSEPSAVFSRVVA